MKDKVILFDWGNIVESHTTGYTIFTAMNDTYRKCGYNKPEDVYVYLKKYRLTAIDSEEKFKETYYKIKEELNLNTTYEEFEKIYKETHDKIEYYTNVRDYELSLKDRCCVGILSNLNVFDGPRLDKELGKENYDYVFLSYELGCRKPEKEIFEKVTNKLPFKKENILLVDDRKDNVEAAASIGWKTIHATGLELDRIKREIEEFLNN